MLNMLANSVPHCWLSDPAALYCSPSDQSSSFASSTQPSPAIAKSETKPAACPPLAICTGGGQLQQQPHHLASFVQSAFGTTFSAGMAERTRPAKRKPRPVPDDEKKTEAYRERRRKNNDSARRSREQRRRKEEETQLRNAELEQENARLRQENNALLVELYYLRHYCGGLGMTGAAGTGGGLGQVKPTI